ncbi:MAG: hypothetical protein WC856_06610 [Methylococcaceae bacterium]|jgi:hypothetical protein
MNESYAVLYEIFTSIRKERNIFFKNDDKFLKVIEYWIKIFYLTYYSMHEKKLTVLDLDVETAKRSILRTTFTNNNKSTNPNTKRINKYLPILLFFSKYFRPKVGILPGGLSHSFLDKLKYILLFIKVKSAKVSIDKEFKILFLKKVEIIFGENLYYDLLVALIPNIFFVNKLNNNNFFPSKLKGSPNSFLDNNYNYIKLLLTDDNISITGIQHGGSYGEWIDNPFEEFDLSISDKFYGWGLLTNNISQNRFKKLSNKINSEIFWIGRGRLQLESTEMVSFDSYDKHLNDVSHIEAFAKYFQNYNIVFLEHPRDADPVYKNIFNCGIERSSSAETLITNSKLVIFDCLSNTSMYYCIYYYIPFIILLNKFPLDGLTENALRFYHTLSRNNLLITLDDCLNYNSKLDFIKSYLDDNQNHFFSKEVIEYFESHFKSKITIKDI